MTLLTDGILLILLTTFVTLFITFNTFFDSTTVFINCSPFFEISTMAILAPPAVARTMSPNIKFSLLSNSALNAATICSLVYLPSWLYEYAQASNA